MNTIMNVFKNSLKNPIMLAYVTQLANIISEDYEH